MEQGKSTTSKALRHSTPNSKEIVSNKPLQKKTLQRKTLSQINRTTTKALHFINPRMSKVVKKQYKLKLKALLEWIFVENPSPEEIDEMVQVFLDNCPEIFHMKIKIYYDVVATLDYDKDGEDDEEKEKEP